MNSLKSLIEGKRKRDRYSNTKFYLAQRQLDMNGAFWAKLF